MTATEKNKPLADDELLITRVFDAPVAMVWQMWEEPEHMIRWWGPEEFVCESLEVDFRPGGAWRALIVSDAHGKSWSGGVFREIVKEKKLVFTFAWEPGSGETEETIVTVGFAARGQKTVQTFHQTPFASVESRDGHLAGWHSLFNKEEAYAAALASGGTPAVGRPA